MPFQIRIPSFLFPAPFPTKPSPSPDPLLAPRGRASRRYSLCPHRQGPTGLGKHVFRPWPGHRHTRGISRTRPLASHERHPTRSGNSCRPSPYSETSFASPTRSHSSRSHAASHSHGATGCLNNRKSCPHTSSCCGCPASFSVPVRTGAAPSEPLPFRRTCRSCT